jgi:putative nucleotidyltransferase with HDIG domain
MTNPNESLRRLAPPELFELAGILAASGHAVFAVGGSVRDLALGLDVNDWDVATSATPDEVSALFDRTTRVNARHGTTQVRLGDWAFEVTTFREDGPYGDRRRPDYVRFASDIRTDLERRDFTVNAMAVDLRSGAFLDPFSGMDDLRARVLRTVGDPARRLSEDVLRLLRAARFSASLELEPTPDLRSAMGALAGTIRAAAPERCRDELMKLLAARTPSIGLRLLGDSGLLAEVLPELDACRGVAQNEYHAFDVFEHSVRACDHAPLDQPTVRWAALLHDVGKVPTREVREGRVTFYGHERVGADLVAERLRLLRFPRRVADVVVHLILHHMFHYETSWTDAAVRRFVARVGLDSLDALCTLRLADSKARGIGDAESADLSELRARIEVERERRVAFRVRDLAVSGLDLMTTLGLEPGPKVGQLLRELVEFVLEGGGENSREVLLLEAQRRLEAPGTRPRR